MIKATIRKMLPGLPFTLAVGAVIASLMMVALARLTGFSPEQEVSSSAVLESRLLRFARNATGDVDVIDAGTGEMISNAGREGFIPGVLRGLQRLRRTSDASTTDAYRLERLQNGQLLLIDMVSGVTLDLSAYGQSNARSFREFLPSRGDKS